MCIIVNQYLSYPKLICIPLYIYIYLSLLIHIHKMDVSEKKSKNKNISNTHIIHNTIKQCLQTHRENIGLIYYFYSSRSSVMYGPSSMPCKQLLYTYCIMYNSTYGLAPSFNIQMITTLYHTAGNCNALPPYLSN